MQTKDVVIVRGNEQRYLGAFEDVQLTGTSLMCDGVKYLEALNGEDWYGAEDAQPWEQIFVI